MADLVLLNPHDRMTAHECLEFCARDHADYQDCIVIGYDQAGVLTVRSSAMTRADATFMLMKALDHAMGR